MVTKTSLRVVIVWGLSILVACPQAYGRGEATPLIAHPELPKREYQYLLNRDSALTSYVNHQTIADNTLEHEMTSKFSQGKLYQLQGDTISAQTHYKDVFRWHSQLIAMSDQTALLVEQAIEQLIHLTDNPTEKSFWNREGLRLKLLQKLTPDPSSKQPLKYWMPAKHLRPFDMISINGVRYELTDSLVIPLLEGQYRVRALSNTYLPVTLSASVDELIKWSPTASPILTGDCTNPKLNESVDQTDKVEVLYSKNCRLALAGTSIHRYSREDGFIEDYQIQAPQIPLFEKHEDEPTKHWIGYIIVALGAGAVIAHQLQDKEIVVEWP